MRVTKTAKSMKTKRAKDSLLLLLYQKGFFVESREKRRINLIGDGEGISEIKATGIFLEKGKKIGEKVMIILVFPVILGHQKGRKREKKIA